MMSRWVHVHSLSIFFETTGGKIGAIDHALEYEPGAPNGFRPFRIKYRVLDNIHRPMEEDPGWSCEDGDQFMMAADAMRIFQNMVLSDYEQVASYDYMMVMTREETWCKCRRLEKELHGRLRELELIRKPVPRTISDEAIKAEMFKPRDLQVE